MPFIWLGTFLEIVPSWVPVLGIAAILCNPNTGEEETQESVVQTHCH